MASIELIARDEKFHTIKRYRKRRYSTNVNAIIGLGNLEKRGVIDDALRGADNVLAIIRDDSGHVLYRNLYR